MQIFSRLKKALILQQQWEEDIDRIRRARVEPRFASPYVSTPMSIVREMLDLAEVGEGDVLYDLGCGDGRLILTAAVEYGAKCIGIEIRRDLVEKALADIERAGVQDRVKIILGDMFEQDLREATVVSLYLLSIVNAHLRPKLEAELRKGTRVVCHDYDIDGWEPLIVKKVGGRILRHRLYLYRI
ncbi:MAG: SAM-dependent methyltransferase [Thermoproteota archaeon]